MDKVDLEKVVLEAIVAHKGKANLVQVAKYIWDNYNMELQKSDILYTWQYDMRWAAYRLRKDGKLKQMSECDRGAWELA